mmetsp:Transcript_12192/g.25392  ORF Transcript_12192/g.25392 Transcript_12192/m.25392 type:complete len:322 (-) Transcript_12192:314-1279(-)
MLETLKYGDLVEELGVVLRFEIAPLHHLDGHGLVRLTMPPLPDGGEGSRAYLLLEFVHVLERLSEAFLHLFHAGFLVQGRTLVADPSADDVRSARALPPETHGLHVPKSSVHGPGDRVERPPQFPSGVELAYLLEAAADVPSGQLAVVRGDPGRFQSPLGGHTNLRVHLQQRRDQLLRLDAYVLPEFVVKDVIGRPDLAEQSAGVLVLEGGIPPEEQVQYDPHGPHVDGVGVGTSHQNFGRHERGRAASGNESIGRAVRKSLGETEIGELGVGVRDVVDQKHVFRFQVPVDDAAPVHVPYRLQQIAGQIPGVLFGVGGFFR